MKKFILEILTVKTTVSSPIDLEHSLQVATAVLLIEVVRADFIVEAAERLRLRQLLKTHFDLNRDELDALLEQAEDDADQLVSLQHVTRLMNENYDHAMKRRVLEMMWHMVYADGEKDHYEEHLIRQVAELLYLSHGEFIQARHLAEENQR